MRIKIYLKSCVIVVAILLASCSTDSYPQDTDSVTQHQSISDGDVALTLYGEQAVQLSEYTLQIRESPQFDVLLEGTVPTNTSLLMIEISSTKHRSSLSGISLEVGAEHAYSPFPTVVEAGEARLSIQDFVCNDATRNIITCMVKNLTTHTGEEISITLQGSLDANESGELQLRVIYLSDYDQRTQVSKQDPISIYYTRGSMPGYRAFFLYNDEHTQYKYSYQHKTNLFARESFC